MSYWHIVDCILIFKFLLPRFTPPENLSGPEKSGRLIFGLMLLFTMAGLIQTVLPDFGVGS